MFTSASVHDLESRMFVLRFLTADWWNIFSVQSFFYDNFMINIIYQIGDIRSIIKLMPISKY